ncbi:hypothetical protein ACIBF6_03810 [Streptosporangium amethystogenes]|uniref:hypothetical protein n=1 Tax=Streptosporangium amethystogenes TaxID=2002 RepID=UPI0037952F8D
MEGTVGLKAKAWDAAGKRVEQTTLMSVALGGDPLRVTALAGLPASAGPTTSGYIPEQVGGSSKASVPGSDVLRGRGCGQKTRK